MNFGSGGYAHNTELVGIHQPGLYGSCAMSGSTGDFMSIAADAGAGMGALGTAWRTQVVLEEALENHAIGLGAFVLPGDSMVVVNKYGKRIVNEKINYNDRTELHFVFDPVAKEYPNQCQFMIFDERTLDGFGGAFPLPNGQSHPFLIQGATLAELTTNITARLQKHRSEIGSFTLSPYFTATLRETVARFNGYAKSGRDEEFGRGLHAYDRDWPATFSSMRKGTAQPVNPRPNVTMHPLAEWGRITRSSSPPVRSARAAVRRPTSTRRCSMPTTARFPVSRRRATARPAYRGRRITEPDTRSVLRSPSAKSPARTRQASITKAETATAEGALADCDRGAAARRVLFDDGVSRPSPPPRLPRRRGAHSRPWRQAKSRKIRRQTL
ncbi:flavoprotein, similar to 3-ketosteroid 1-dehydrogenase (plasmid) [Aromatoleum aromaticum EbN1]|uniref:Flavoprotein, similar to 3-ketosteroid 1-dehydrogenase n=1 Tax=Aromatoleum aromaticum (strain DSM 19018 / LMG 30748 / EbN1) TaxID=76114 RepID=Q5NW83_AROAE|nr:flavoprotein, similar to 3-ketosteroid 1-dehydrogenase [Aromatoleum aromaticum EbN1]